MTYENAVRELEAIPTPNTFGRGMTKVVNGLVVTRWNMGCFEVGTFRVTTQNLATAAMMIHCNG